MWLFILSFVLCGQGSSLLWTPVHRPYSRPVLLKHVVMSMRKYGCYLFAPTRGAKYCDQCVCLFVCSLAYVKSHTSKFHQIFCTYYPLPRFDRLLTAVRNIMYFWFFWMMSIRIMEGIVRIKDNAYVSSRSPGGGTGGKVCRLRQ